MIIVSQDKDMAVKFSRCNGILQEENEVVAMLEGQEWVIGIYKTEQRAKEVFQHLITRYSNWENMQVGQPSGICEPVYYMPED